jgi:hypothetical protein
LPLLLSYPDVPDPEKPSWSEYAERTQREFTLLLDSDPPETEVQAFLEAHPSLVPGARTLGGKSGHSPLHSALISQPKLPSLESRQPDLMWVSTHSLNWFPTLIELERPGKRLFTKGGVPSAEFNQARNQLAQWRTWFSDPAHQQVFCQEYGVPNSWTSTRQMRLITILVYGRQSEFEGKPSLSKHRASLMPGADEELMSYDRLELDEWLRETITVRPEGAGQYRVLRAPTVLSLDSRVARRQLHVDGFDEALRQNQEISEERRSFLLEGFKSLKAWATTQRERGADW